jgi:hypothetical protein
MPPPIRPQTDDDDLDRLLHPSRFYDRPADVLADRSLKPTEQRAILSSWASDACAIDSRPILRHPPFAARPATFEDVMDALMALDRHRSQPSRMAGPRRPSARTAGSDGS